MFLPNLLSQQLNRPNCPNRPNCAGQATRPGSPQLFLKTPANLSHSSLRHKQ